jgi:hypothetical protein
MDDLALGEAITSQVSVHDQVAALRKQVVALSTASRVPLAEEMTALEATVSDEKAKQKPVKPVDVKPVDVKPVNVVPDKKVK